MLKGEGGGPPATTVLASACRVAMRERAAAAPAALFLYPSTEQKARL